MKQTCRLYQIKPTSAFALFLLMGFCACLHFDMVPVALTGQEHIKVYDIQHVREDPTLFTMWVLYDPVAPPSQDNILAKVKYECDRFCKEKGYYGYIIEKSHDYELDRGMMIEVRFFGFKWDFDQYVRTHQS